MRIAIVGPTHPYKGGVAQHTTEFAHRLAGRGHDVRLESWSAQYPARLYPGRQRVEAPEVAPFQATSYPLSWRRPDSWWRLGFRLRRQVEAVVLVVVTPVQAPAYLGVLAGLRAGVRDDVVVLALCHNVLPHERRSIDERLVGAVLRRASEVLVHTPAQAELAGTLTLAPVHVAEMAPHLWTDLGVAPAASPTDASPPAAAPPAASPVAASAVAGASVAASPLDASPLDAASVAASPVGAAPVASRRRLLFFGLVRPYKGLDVLLRALALGPAGVELTVAGEFWGGTKATEQLVDELDLGDRVELRPGYVAAAKVPALFAAADALVLPYRSGTASQNVDLAHLYGLPVVATTVGTLSTAVRDGVDGLLVPPDDVQAMAGALRRLYEPGVLDGFRAKVVAPDATQAWHTYLDTVERALASARR